MVSFRDKLVHAPVAYTFRDVIIVPGFAEVEPSEVDLSTKVTKSFSIKIPIISSPMDTVTEERMAIALARLGSLGVLHRNCSKERAIEMARNVKEASEVIDSVPTLSPNDSVARALELMREHNIDVLPVVDGDGRLLGTVIKVDVLLNLSEEPVASIVRRDIPILDITADVSYAASLMRESKLTALPVVTKDGRYLGFIRAEMLSTREKGIEPSRGRDGRLLCAAAISPFDIDRARALDKYVDILVIDVAHFHNRNCINATKKLVKEVSADIVVGNIGTYNAAEDVVTSIERVDGMRVGISSGSICSTGEVTGVAAPTLFAVAEVADALKDYGLEIPVIADGGIRSAADAAKAFAVGAWCVMCGYLFAGCDESPSPVVRIGGKLYKYYRGMGSHAARVQRYILDRYSPVAKQVAEGIEALVPYRGPVSKVLREFAAALKAALGYAGAKSIRDMWEKAKVAVITEQGAGEIRPHSVEPL